MKVGLYFDLRVPPHVETPPARVYAHTLEMCEEAERLGAESLWFSEHHLFDDGYLPQPLTMAAAAAARTSHVRLGTALVVGPLHHPAELAEQAAVVDLISDGRLDLGLGAGYREPEFALYGQDRDARFPALAAMVPELNRLWTEELTPAPVQPTVPIWLGHGSEAGARRAGALGANLLFVNPDLLPAYEQGRAAAGLAPGDGKMGGPLFALASDDPEAEWTEMAPFIEYQQNSYRRHMVQGLDQPAPRPFDAEGARQGSMTRPGSFWFDTSDAIAERVGTWLGDAPIDTLFLWASVGGMPERMVERNVRMICEKVAPALRAL
ncbi:LLM class flavin-dependent oxidoreductase [Pseudonocardia xishanensis]|uniref:LLM class flavin-dependent oxidoreductase n=1 Tax=Pseudonocardia xishanensis TaxID=630995 RepID=A0ABP8RP79_9PSEU